MKHFVESFLIMVFDATAYFRPHEQWRRRIGVSWLRLWLMCSSM